MNYSKKLFTYQNFWARHCALLPLIIVLPFFELLFLEDINEFLFFVISAIITIIIACIFYKPLGKFFIAKGEIIFEDEDIVIKTKNRIIQIDYKSIKTCKCSLQEVYRVCFGVFVIEYEEAGKSKMYRIISEDLVIRKKEECDLWHVAAEIRKRML